MILVADNSFNTSHLVNKYVKVSPSLNSVKVVRNYKNQVDFGSDPITDEIWYHTDQQPLTIMLIVT